MGNGMASPGSVTVEIAKLSTTDRFNMLWIESESVYAFINFFIRVNNPFR